MKGIREFVNAKFAEQLPKLKEMGGKNFRKTVMQSAIEAFGISVASAATHYNFSLKSQRAADPKSVEGLGRPEDKKGGRPAIHTVTVVKVKTGEVVAEGLSKGAAQQLIDAAAKAKNKPKLMIKEVTKEEAAATKAAMKEEAKAEEPQGAQTTVAGTEEAEATA